MPIWSAWIAFCVNTLVKENRPQPYYEKFKRSYPDYEGSADAFYEAVFHLRLLDLKESNMGQGKYVVEREKRDRFVAMHTKAY
jgi:hypothetical protein